MEEQDVMDVIRTAIADGDMEQANRLLNDNNGIIKELTSFNGTLLHDAVRYNQKELATRLIDMGIDIHIKCPGSAARGLAINSANTKEMAEVLMDKGLKPELSLEDFEDNPIFPQIKQDDLEMFLFWFDYENARFNPKEQARFLKAVKKWAKIFDSTEILEYLGINSKAMKKHSPKMSKGTLEKFEKLLLNTTKKAYSSITAVYSDVYAFSMVCTNTFDYIYYVANTEEQYHKMKIESKMRGINISSFFYRYNEEEWKIAVDKGESFEELHELLDQIEQENPEEYDSIIVDICTNVIKKLRDENYFSKECLINLHIWEYFTNEYMMEMFLDFNNKNEADAYKRFLMG